MTVSREREVKSRRRHVLDPRQEADLGRLLGDKPIMGSTNGDWSPPYPPDPITRQLLDELDEACNARDEKYLEYVKAARATETAHRRSASLYTDVKQLDDTAQRTRAAIDATKARRAPRPF